MKKILFVAVILFLGLSLAAGDYHEHQQTASCPGCLHAPVLIEAARAPVLAALVEFGALSLTADPQPISRLGVVFTLLRAPPLA
ncbi:MAG TPA: hypothetical protein VFY29_13995 [Terriglobia bacterium]|nr:hypothetical protein [Terriglobia bacterium]